MKRESLPPIKAIYEAIENAAVDVYGFAVSCQGGVPWMAEPVILDSLFLALENFWFLEDSNGQLSHKEFREEIFRTIWERSAVGASGQAGPVRIGTDVPLGHEEMVFYQLPQLTRAALFLRTKKHFAYTSVALVLGISEGTARGEVERAREFLLGRRLKSFEWSDEDF